MFAQIVKAEDEDGLSSTTIVNIKVSDINDKNPEFQGLPYEFVVQEGKNNAPVGRVHAIDADDGANGAVYYSLTEDVPFIVDANSGDIRTSQALDYEKESVSCAPARILKWRESSNPTMRVPFFFSQEYKFVVTAKDGASEPRLATATVTVRVTDIEDELPIFHVAVHEVKVPENVPDHTVIQVSVSVFLGLAEDCPWMRRR